jgi:hypothetical protein
VSVAIPDTLRALALQRGCVPGDIDGLWQTHCKLCDKDASNYGGPRWLGLVAKHVKDGVHVPTVARPNHEPSEDRKREAEAREREETAYRRTAVGLAKWLASLRARAPSELTSIERRLVAFRAPGKGEAPSAWLLEAMRAFSGEEREGAP